MVRSPFVAILCLSALLAVYAAPSTVHIEVDIPDAYVGEIDVTARVGSNAQPREPTRRERPSDDNTTLSTPMFGPIFDNCDEWHKVSIKNAIETAREFVTDAVTSLTEQGMDPRYQRWFGRPDGTRSAVVLGRFELVASYRFEDWTYLCHNPCPAEVEAATVAAFVDHDAFGDVHLCPHWFDQSEEFRARILIHEATHFKYGQVPGTKDERYGVDRSQRLAQNNPDLAVWNAANYDFFAGDRKEDLQDLGVGNREFMQEVLA